ncbi:hypothetical protein V8C86DRAFT_2639649 [Haematococcus lacustris]
MMLSRFLASMTSFFSSVLSRICFWDTCCFSWDSSFAFSCTAVALSCTAAFSLFSRSPAFFFRASSSLAAMSLPLAPVLFSSCSF